MVKYGDVESHRRKVLRLDPAHRCRLYFRAAEPNDQREYERWHSPSSNGKQARARGSNEFRSSRSGEIDDSQPSARHPIPAGHQIGPQSPSLMEIFPRKTPQGRKAQAARHPAQQISILSHRRTQSRRPPRLATASSDRHVSLDWLTHRPGPHNLANTPWRFRMSLLDPSNLFASQGLAATTYRHTKGVQPTLRLRREAKSSFMPFARSGGAPSPPTISS